MSGFSSENKKPLRVAGVGAGYFSGFHYEAWQRNPNAVCVGICNKTQEKAEVLARQYSIGNVYTDSAAMLDELKPDLLDIITPPETHLKTVRLAAERNIDVICQKPFGENIQQAREMLAICEKAGSKLIVHENFRFMPWYRHIRSTLSSGMCGKILNVQFNLRPGDGQGKEAYLGRQPFFRKMEKFLVHETAIHLIDTFRYLFGEVLSVYADLRRCNTHIAGEDAGIIVFRMENDLQAIFNGNRLLDHNSSNTRRTMGECLIEGTKASLRLDGEARIWLRQFDAQEEEQLEYVWLDRNFGGDCVYLFIDDLVRNYLSGGKFETSAAQYIRNIEIENAVYQSNESGTRIDL